MTDLEMQWLQRNTMALEAIRDTLTAIRQSIMADHVLNYQYDLSAFPRFHWDSIGATVVELDKDGVAIVLWGGHEYKRRSPQNKFGEAIWFSRCTGKGENGENVYQRLITFKRRDLQKATPVPDRVSRHLAPGT